MEQHVSADLGRRAFFATVKFIICLAALIFGPALTLRYWQGWAFWLNVSGWSAALTLYLLLRDPALLQKRLRAGSRAEREPAQKRIMAYVSAVMILFFLVAGLDHHYGWSRVPVTVVWLGDTLVGLGFLAILIVLRENSYASAIVEVSPSQTVISTGPYAYVRHPMYAAASAMFLGAPLALGTWWGLPVMLAMIAGVVARLRDEEVYLITHLHGYQAYLRKVRYRLLPGVW